MLKSTVWTPRHEMNDPQAQLPPRAKAPPAARWELLRRADGLEGIARVSLGEGGPLDAAIGAHLSALREALDARLVVVLERRTTPAPPERDPLLGPGDVLYLIGPPEPLCAVASPPLEERAAAK